MRILFVDDDPILREFAVLNLTTETTRVDVAPDGGAAIAAIQGEAPDILLLDLDMPEGDSLEALARLRAEPRWRSLPVVVVTGREDVEAVERAFAAGATSFVVKPLNWRLLGQHLRYVRRAAAHEQALAEGHAAAAGQLTRLAAEGAQFISAALARAPELRGAAVPFARAADAALKREPKPKAA
jgi:DNA-binding response OmpR family regulator